MLNKFQGEQHLFFGGKQIQIMIVLKNIAFYKKSSFIILFLFIFLSIETLLFGTNGNMNVLLVGYVGYFLLAIYLIFKHDWKIKNKSFILLFLILMSLIGFLFDVQQPLKYFYEIMIILMAYVYVNKYDLKEFKIQYVNLIYIISFISVVLFIASQFISLPFIEIINKNNIPIQSLIFATLSSRNAGLFREPGVFMIFVNLALIFEIFKNKVSFKKVVVFILAVATTYSTAGYIVIAITLCCFILKNKLGLFEKILYTILVFIAFFFVYSSEYTKDVVFGKIENLNNDSTLSRTSSVYYNIELATSSIKSFLIGNGYSITENSFVEASYKMTSVEGNNTNTFLKMLSLHGFIYFFIVFIGNIKFWLKQYGIFMGLLLLFLYILMTSNEDFCLDVLIYILMFYGYFESKTNIKQVDR